MADNARPNPLIRLVFWVIVLLVLVFVTFGECAPLNTRNQLDEARKSKAQLGCQSLATASEAYVQSEANTKHEKPTTLHDLVHPPFGGSPFLRNGDADLLDPWGRPYQFEYRCAPDGCDHIFVWTTAPDGTRISQFGIGPKNSEPRW